MLEKQANHSVGTVDVRFSLHADGHALPVHLAGEFNAWSESGLALAPDEGDLAVTVTLPAGGRFQYRYRDAQGRWFNDPEADDYAANEWGGMNSVVTT